MSAKIDPYKINFTILDIETRNTLLRKLLEPHTLNVVLVPTQVFGSIIYTHFPNVIKWTKNGKRDDLIYKFDIYGYGYDRFHFREEFGMEPLKHYGFEILKITFTHNLIDKAGYKIIKRMLQTGDKYQKSGNNDNGNIITGPFETYPLLDINCTNDKKLFRIPKRISNNCITVLKSTRKLDWLRTLYPKLISMPINIAHCYNTKLPIGDTLYNKLLCYLANNMHLVNFNILPQEVSDSLLQAFIKHNSINYCKGYILRYNIISDLIAAEFDIVSDILSDDNKGRKVKKDGKVTVFNRANIMYNRTIINVSDITNLCNYTTANAYNNTIIRNIYNVTLHAHIGLVLNMDNEMFETEILCEQRIPSMDAKDIAYGSTVFIKSSPEANLLYKKYKYINGVRMISDLVDMPIKLLICAGV